MRVLRICLAVVGSITAGIAVFTAAIAMMMAISAVVRSASVAVPQPGSQAADFVLQDLNGETVRLSQYRGRRVVLVFWADWCRDCHVIVPDLNEIHRRGTPVLAINLMERKALVEAAVARHGMRYRILLDRDGAVGRLYGAHAIPNVFVIDRKGVIEEHTYGAPALRK